MSRDPRLYLGEAAKQLPGEITGRHTAIEWRRIAGFRDVLAHGYLGVADDVLWDVVSNKVPQVQNAVAIALDSMN